MFVMGNDLIQRVEHMREEFFEKVLVPHAVDWNEDTTQFDEQLCVKASTYKVASLFPVTAAPGNLVQMSAKYFALSPCGQYMYCERILPRGRKLVIFKGNQYGTVCFDGDIVVPILSQIHPTRIQPVVWMSLTPMEMMTQRLGITKATKKVVIGGLGLGYLLNKVCAKKSVTEVVVVEKSETLLDWLKPRILSIWPHIEAKVTDWIVDDVYEHVGKHGKETTHLLDIWAYYGQAYKDDNFKKARDKVGSKYIWGWGNVNPPKEI